MSMIHAIVLFLALFLVGVVVLIYLLFPAIRLSMRERTLPRVMAHVIVLSLSWISLYFASILLRYYQIIHFPRWYNVVLAALAAVIPWEGSFWCWRWIRAVDQRNEQDGAA